MSSALLKEKLRASLKDYEHYDLIWQLQVYDKHDKIIQLSEYQQGLVQAIKVTLNGSLLIYGQPQAWTKEETEQWFNNDSSHSFLITDNFDKLNTVRQLYREALETLSFEIFKLCLVATIQKKEKKLLKSSTIAKKRLSFELRKFDIASDFFKVDKIRLGIKFANDFIDITKNQTCLAIKKNAVIQIIVDFKAAHFSRNTNKPKLSFLLDNGEKLPFMADATNTVKYTVSITQDILNDCQSMRLMVNDLLVEEQTHLFSIYIKEKKYPDNHQFIFVPCDKALMLVDGMNKDELNMHFNEKKRHVFQHCFYDKDIAYQLSLSSDVKHNGCEHLLGISQYSATTQTWMSYNKVLSKKNDTPKDSLLLFEGDSNLNSEYTVYDIMCPQRLFDKATLTNNDDLIINLTHNIEAESYILAIDFGTSGQCVALYNGRSKDAEIIQIQNTAGTGLLESDTNIFPTYIDIKPQDLLTARWFPIDTRQTITLENQVSNTTLTSIKILTLVPQINFIDDQNRTRNFRSHRVVKPANQYFIDKIEPALIEVAKKYAINKVMFTMPNFGINSDITGIYIDALKHIVKISDYEDLALSDEAAYKKWASTNLISESQAVLFHYYRSPDFMENKNHCIIFDIGAGTTDITYAQINDDSGKLTFKTKCNLCLPLAGGFIDYIMADAFIHYMFNAEAVDMGSIGNNKDQLFPHKLDIFNKTESRNLKQFIVKFKHQYRHKTADIQTLLTDTGMTNTFVTDKLNQLFQDMGQFYTDFEDTKAISYLGSQSLLSQINILIKGAIDNMIDICSLKKEMAHLRIIVSGRTAKFSLIRTILEENYKDQVVFISNNDDNNDKYAVAKGAAILSKRRENSMVLLKEDLIFPKFFIYKINPDRYDIDMSFIQILDLNEQTEYTFSDEEAKNDDYHFFISYDSRPYNAQTNQPDIKTFINNVYVLEQRTWTNKECHSVLTFKIERALNEKKINIKIYDQAKEKITFNSEPVLDTFFELGVKNGEVPWQRDDLFKQAMWPYYQEIIK